MHVPDPNPADLLAARQGDHEAFGRIVRAFQTRIYRLAWRMVWDEHEARDMAQEVFLRLFRAFDRYDPARPFGPWFHRLAVNVCLNKMKKFRAMRHPSIDANAGADPACPTPDSGEQAQAGEMKTRLRRAIRQLPDTYRVAVSLRHLDGMSYEDMAEILDLPLGTVKNRLFRGREKLKAILSPEKPAVANGTRFDP